VSSDSEDFANENGQAGGGQLQASIEPVSLAEATPCPSGVTALLSNVLCGDFCCGCGACIAVCPRNAFQLRADGIVELRPSYDTVLCRGCFLCARVCPSLEEGSRRRFEERRAARSPVGLGQTRATVRAWATSNRIRKKASSGGAVTGLLLWGLGSGLFDGTVVTGRNAEKPWLPHPMLTSDPEMVVECAQSTYAITPALTAFRNQQGCGSSDSVAVVGLPCHMRALARIEQLRGLLPWKLPKIAVRLELACSSATLISGAKSLIQTVCDVRLDQVAEVKYREGDYPGCFCITTKDRRKVSVPFWQMVTHFQQFKPWRCQVCSDWVSGLADLSFADGTDDPFSLSRSGQTGVRQSFVFVWSRRGEDLLRSAVETGYLGCEESIFKANAGLELKKKRLAEATKVLNGRGNIELLANIHTRQWAL